MKLSISHAATDSWFFYLDDEAQLVLGGSYASVRVYYRAGRTFIQVFRAPDRSPNERNSPARLMRKSPNSSDWQLQYTERSVPNKELLGTGYFGKTALINVIRVGNTLEGLLPEVEVRNGSSWIGRSKVLVPETKPESRVVPTETEVRSAAPPSAPVAAARVRVVEAEPGKFALTDSSGGTLVEGLSSVAQATKVASLMGIPESAVELPARTEAANSVDPYEFAAQMAIRGIRTKLLPSGAVVTVVDKKKD